MRWCARCRDTCARIAHSDPDSVALGNSVVLISELATWLPPEVREHDRGRPGQGATRKYGARPPGSMRIVCYGSIARNAALANFSPAMPAGSPAKTAPA